MVPVLYFFCGSHALFPWSLKSAMVIEDFFLFMNGSDKCRNIQCAVANVVLENKSNIAIYFCHFMVDNGMVLVYTPIIFWF